MVLRAIALRNQARVTELVERALLEADRERAQRLAGRFRGECRKGGRVDPAREQHTDRDVRDQVGSDRVPQAGAELLDQLGLVVLPELVRGCRRRPGEALEPEVAILPDEQVARRELARMPED